MKPILRVTALMALAALLLCGCGTQAVTRTSTQEVTALSDTTEETQQTQQAGDEALSFSGRCTIGGVTYSYNTRLRTVLFMGVDSRTTEQLEKNGIGAGGRSDTMILLVIDPDAGTVQPITLSRDTMTKVDVYDRDRNFLFSGTMQLTMQYSFGDNAKRSCLLTKSKVSELLGGLPISSYCSLTLEGIVAASEALGGVTLTLTEDWTDIDPTYVAGATITMDGDTLESFLRYRDTSETGSNNVRMRRHRWFIQQMFTQMGKLSTAQLEELLGQLDPYLETDMDADTMVQMLRYQLSGEMLNIPGETIQGKAHDEYYIDEAALKQLLLDVYFTAVEE